MTPSSLFHIPTTLDSTTREHEARKLTEREPLDILVVGGGIHGAVAARIAAASGFATALVDRADFGGATSSRSSKMAHGGLRYLELLDFEQVFEGIKAREEMFRHISHLVQPSEFLIPVPSGKFLFKWKLGIGLYLYDLLSRDRKRQHRWIPREDLTYPGYNSEHRDLMGCYLYYDGIMSDARLVIENVLAARRAGASTLNYCEVLRSQTDADGIHTVTLKDSLSGRELSLRTRLIINCAGPWCGALTTRLGGESHPLKFSRGSHIIFSKPWRGPSLFLPMEGKARYYFVWPHPAGTLVGTTEREVSELQDDPIPSRDEIDEILARLERDIPDAGLRRENACYCFAGIRTLPLRRRDGASSTLSRKHIWEHSNGILTLSGGKYTTAWWTSCEGVTLAAQLLGRPLDEELTRYRPDLLTVPGSMSTEERSLVEEGLHGLSPSERSSMLARYGKRLLMGYDLSRLITSEARIAFETEIALETEQVEGLDDLMRHRLELEYLPGHGLTYLPIIKEIFNRLRPQVNFEREADAYRARMHSIDTLLA